MLAELVTWVMPARVRSAGNQLQPASMVPVPMDDIALVLTRLIEAARQQAIANGVRPIPPAVYRSLLGYFPAALLQKTRFASGKAVALTVPVAAFTYGDAIAITLGDVVLVNSERLAQSDLRLWAHELTHVMQCQRWGIDGFAACYVRDSAMVEQEAIDNANRFIVWLSRPGP